MKGSLEEIKEILGKSKKKEKIYVYVYVCLNNYQPIYEQ